jgi:hypothetical protein
VVEAHFVRIQQSADQTIRARLNQLGRVAKNWSVVSSDREVQNYAHAHQAQVLSSDAFAAMLRVSSKSEVKSGNEERGLSSEEVDAWPKIFKQRDQSPD